MQLIFHTAPNTHIELSELGNNTFYILGQEYKKSQSYREYTHKAIKDGRFTILDSGMGDHGDFLTNKEMFELVKELHPSEVIPTDNLYNKELTIQHTQQMIDWMKKDGLLETTKILMCPQGNTIDEYISCWKWAIDNECVSTIGMSKKTVPHVIVGEANDLNIAKARHIMYDILKVRGLMTKPIHMLGSEGPFEYEYYGDDKMIRSTDSCVAIWQGCNNSTFDQKDYQRIPTPSNYFDIVIEPHMKDSIKFNTDFFNKCIK